MIYLGQNSDRKQLTGGEKREGDITGLCKQFEHYNMPQAAYMYQILLKLGDFYTQLFQTIEDSKTVTTSSSVRFSQ
jgi:hypothetical protein